MFRITVLCLLVIALSGCGHSEKQTVEQRIQAMKGRYTLLVDDVTEGDSFRVVSDITEIPRLGIGLVVIQRQHDGLLFNARVALPAQLTLGEEVQVQEYQYLVNEVGHWERDYLWIIK